MRRGEYGGLGRKSFRRSSSGWRILVSLLRGLRQATDGSQVSSFRSRVCPERPNRRVSKCISCTQTQNLHGSAPSMGVLRVGSHDRTVEFRVPITDD